MEEAIREGASENTNNSGGLALMFGMGIGLLILGNKIGGMVGVSIDILSDFFCVMAVLWVVIRTFKKAVSFKGKMIGWAIFAWWFIIEFFVIVVTNKY